MELNQDVVPRTLHEAVGLLLGALSGVDRAVINRSTSPSGVHHTIGLYIRNSWSLWQPDMPLSTWFLDNMKIWHPDDMSGLIFYGVWSFCNGQLPNYAKEVERYHKHWANYGLNPHTGETLK